MKNKNNIIKKIFEEATNNFKYKWGVQKIEKKLKQNKALITNNNLCDLGHLYDHLALQQKKTALRKKYENQALRLYRRALKINLKSYRATWGIGRIWWHRNNKKAIPYALKAYHLRKRAKKDAGLYAQAIGLVYQSLKNYKRAEYWLLRGAKENKKDFGVYLNLVAFYRLIGDFKKAQKYALGLKELYNKESSKFKKTAWGKIIKQIIKNSDKPLLKN